jgi:hypothetical protein
VRLDRARREIGRLCAPARNVPDGFLPVELEPRTHSVLLVVTRMPSSMRELLEPPTPHGFRLILKAS